MVDTPLPKQVEARLLQFMREARTGSVTLHIQDGNVKACEVKESFKLTC